MVAAIALVVVPPSPPSVSEFAPQAVERIEDSPAQQSSQFGAGGAGGVCLAGQLCEGGSPAEISPPKRVVEKARVRRCVGDPPRQIEDPQSPPCVNYFEGDNGGSTSKGVTRDQIVIAVPGNATMTENSFGKLVDFFNRRFEFYGRKILIVPVRLAGSRTDPAGQRATATRVDEEAGAFASTTISEMNDDSSAFDDELARRQILSVHGSASLRGAEDYRANRPYQWNYGPDLDQLTRNRSEFVCKSLADLPAKYGGLDISANRRKFAILLARRPGSSVPDAQGMSSQLADCGVESRVAEFPNGGDVSSQTLVMTELSRTGVTSLLCLCGMDSIREMAAAADNARYQPEWILGGLALDEREVEVAANMSDRQNGHVFGLLSVNKLKPYSQEPWYWAVRETDQNYSVLGNQHPLMSGPYNQLLLLASGIQMAGPRLTPQSFEKGLQGAKFPNPGAARAPYWQASAGFLNDYTMVDDVALLWWDQTSNNEGVGVGRGQFCFIERGARWAPGLWPSREHAFFDKTQPCR